jgi:hypothetical protein
MTIRRRAALYTLLAVLYLVSTVPVGLFLYSLKTRASINVFEQGGFDTYMHCLRTSFRPRDMNYIVRRENQSCDCLGKK